MFKFCYCVFVGTVLIRITFSWALLYFILPMEFRVTILLLQYSWEKGEGEGVKSRIWKTGLIDSKFDV